MTDLAVKSNGRMQVFENPQFGKVRTVTGADGEPWFVGKDVCEVFGDTNHKRSLSRIADDERRNDIAVADSMGRSQFPTFVNEGGLYALLFTMQPEHGGTQNDPHVQERMRRLRDFRRWVTHDVLPAIRKHGAYSLTPRTLQEALRAYADELDANENMRKALAASNEQVEDLKVRLDESESFWSILTLCEKYGFDWGIKKRGLAGKRASAYCRGHGYEIRRAHDDRFGEVNAYPREVLDKLFVAGKF